MSRKFALSLLSLAGSALAYSLPAAAEGYTTRIETRPFYGAVVTLEEGVRVFRPLPPERQIIINPNGQTPLSLGFNETRVYENNRNYNYNHSNGSGAAQGYAPRGYYGFAPGYGRGHGGKYHKGNGISGTPAGH